MQTTCLLTTLVCAALTAFSHPTTAAPGDLDLTFGGTGRVTTAVGSSGSGANSVSLQSDGKIVVAGFSNNGSRSEFAVVRYNANGNLDTTFNGTGKVTTAFGSSNDIGQSVAVQSDGKIVVAGHSLNGITPQGYPNTDFAVVRYNTDGSLDLTFNGSGKVITDFGLAEGDYANAVVVQSDGKILGHVCKPYFCPTTMVAK